MALLKVFNDISIITDSGGAAVLVFLDLTAAFDTIDHEILLLWLEHLVGLKGAALNWFRSYLTGRHFSVTLNSSFLSSAPLKCGVPQGSILGPIMFSIYLHPIGAIFRKFNISFHCYADDTQVYIPVCNSAMNQLHNCLSELRSWMANNFLDLNQNKIEVLIVGPSAKAQIGVRFLSSFSVFCKPQVCNLGVIFDSNLSFEKQVNSVVKSCFFQLRLLGKLKPLSSSRDLEKATHAFIFSRLDYCNSL
uniref:Reverse transcriptase domain-containing protein n=1 Tax=Erpetoichthys calabaricus TaxID=27687 RepID=A0A8C4X8L7_ERPCA